MTKLLLFTLLLTAMGAGVSGENQISIVGHRWCKKSKLAYEIVKKMEEIYGGQFIFQYNIKNTSETSSVPFPSIRISCQSQITNYENQLTFLQFEYWAHVLCKNAIPKCKKWMSTDHTYQVNPIQPPTLLLAWVKEHPSVKICSNSSVLREKDDKIISLLQQVEGLQYFNEFSHNLRSQLVKNGKTVIGFLYRKKNNRLRDFETHHQRLKENDKRLGYHLSEQGRQNVIFLSDNLKRKIVKKLLNFIGVELQQNQMIVWFKFVEGQLMGGVYGTLEMDNMFTYWVEQMSEYRKPNSEVECLSNSFTHFYRQNSLQSIEANVQVQKWMKQINTEGKVNFMSTPVLWINPDKQFVLCRKGKTKIQTGNLHYIQQAIEQIYFPSFSQEL